MDTYHIAFYREPTDKYLIVHGATERIFEICKALKGKRYPYIKHHYTNQAIRFGWKIPLEKYNDFITLITGDNRYDILVQDTVYS